MSHPDEKALSAESKNYPGITASDFLIVVGSVVAALFFLLVAFYFSGIRISGGLLPVVLPLAAVCTAVIALLKPRWIFYGYISLCMIMPQELQDFFIQLSFMKIYPQDLLFVYFTLLCAAGAVTGKTQFHQIAYNKMMVLYIMLGVWAAAVGLLFTGNEYDNVFGDFRQSFFYFIAYFFALALTQKPEEIRYLKLALLIGTTGVIIRGLATATLGDFVTRRFGDAAHIMNHFEVTFSTLAIYIALTRLTLGTNNKLLWIGLALAGLLIVVLGNFRTCWVGFLGGLSVLFFLLPRIHRRRLSIIMALSFAVGALGLVAIWDVPVEESHSTIGENIAQKADVTGVRGDTNVAWRMDSYNNALNLWKTQPIIGRGLGEELEFATTTSTGKPMMAMGHRVHNSYLWLLMSLGALGFSVLVYLHWRYIRIVYKALKYPGLTNSARITLTAASAFYAAILVSALFDVYLESSPPITMVSVIMAMCLLTIRYDRPAVSLKD